MYKVIIAEKYDDERFIISKHDLECVIEQAYCDGYTKGLSTNSPVYPYITYCDKPDYTITTKQDTPFTYTTITCSNDTNGTR